MCGVFKKKRMPLNPPLDSGSSALTLALHECHSVVAFSAASLEVGTLERHHRVPARLCGNVTVKVTASNTPCWVWLL